MLLACWSFHWKGEGRHGIGVVRPCGGGYPDTKQDQPGGLREKCVTRHAVDYVVSPTHGTTTDGLVLVLSPYLKIKSFWTKFESNIENINHE